MGVRGDSQGGDFKGEAYDKLKSTGGYPDISTLGTTNASPPYLPEPRRVVIVTLHVIKKQ